MPTIIREGGFNIKINTNDHEPMHVHIWHQGNVLIVEFENQVISRDNYGFNQAEQRQAIEIVRKYRDLLVVKWREIYG